MLNVTETARALGVSPRTVKRIPPSQLPYVRIGSRGDRRYSVTELERYTLERTMRL